MFCFNSIENVEIVYDNLYVMCRCEFVFYNQCISDGICIYICIYYFLNGNYKYGGGIIIRIMIGKEFYVVCIFGYFIYGF